MKIFYMHLQGFLTTMTIRTRNNKKVSRYIIESVFFSFSGVTPFEVLFSHVITQFVVMCGQTALVLIFMIVVFQVECRGDINLVIILTILQGLCGMCFGKFNFSFIYQLYLLIILFDYTKML